MIRVTAANMRFCRNAGFKIRSGFCNCIDFISLINNRTRIAGTSVNPVSNSSSYMKYLIVIIIVLSCKSSTNNVLNNSKSNHSQTVQRKDSFTLHKYDPFITGKDTLRLNLAINSIYNFPEVQAIDERINTQSEMKNGVAFMVHDNFGGDTSYYRISVGNNSRSDRFETIYNFLFAKKTSEIKVVDPINDSIITLDQWRIARASNK